MLNRQLLHGIYESMRGYDTFGGLVGLGLLVGYSPVIIRLWMLLWLTLREGTGYVSLRMEYDKWQVIIC